MEKINDIETYLKAIVAIVGAIAAIGKLRDSFASFKRKQELKLDLEILDKLKSDNSFEIIGIEEKINHKLKKAFEDRNENLTNFFVGIAVFVGFGFWTVDIFKNSNEFNGWVILTLMCSLTGLSLVFGADGKKENEELFYKIGLYNKSNFVFGIIFILMNGILSCILFLKTESFSFWLFLTLLFFVIGIGGLFRFIKRIN